MAGPRFALRTGTARPVENEFGFQTSDHEEALAAAEAHGDTRRLGQYGDPHHFTAMAPGTLSQGRADETFVPGAMILFDRRRNTRWVRRNASNNLNNGLLFPP
jgi:hypothetical protein